MKLSFCQTCRCLKGRDVPPHTHEALELVYYTDGRGTSCINGITHRVGRGVFTLTPAGIRHDQENHTDLHSICLGLIRSGLERLHGSWIDTEGALGRACRRLAAELSAGRPAHQRITRGLLEEIAGLIERTVAELPRPAGPRGMVARAIDIIRHEEGALSVGDVAEHLYVSKDYLRHLFRECAGASPMQHIIQARIERAKDLLADPALSIKEVAGRAGFESQYYFSRLFRKVTGRTPSSFRLAR